MTNKENKRSHLPAKPTGIVNNDAPGSGYVITEVTFTYVFKSSPAEFHRATVSLGGNQTYSHQAATRDVCLGIFCTASVTISENNHRLLSQRTEFFDNAGGWEVYSFPVSDMNEGPK